MYTRTILIVLLAVGFTLAAGTQAQTIRDDAQSRCMPTGPAPEQGYQSYEEAINTRGQNVIPGVPGYSWRHGCGPTAAGMVIGYWDGNGFPYLIPGDASTQTTAVNQAIASGNGSATHYSDYSLPMDSSPDPIQPDLSTTNPGAAHASDCLADYMRTSWSASNNYYGWSWFSHVDDSLRSYVNDYVNNTYSAGYTATSWNESSTSFTWNDFTTEIDAGRPLVFLVDTDGNGGTDHFVTAIGYRDTSGYQEYACLDTWSPASNIRWQRFRYLGSGAWSIYGATYFHIDIVDCNGNGTPDDQEIAADPSLDCQPDGVLDECQLIGNDCDDNGEIDSCEIADDPSLDCQPDGILDVCQIAALDCDSNGEIDSCEIAEDPDLDCQPDGILDVCQLTGNDCNYNNIPDDCEQDKLIETQPVSVHACANDTAVFTIYAPQATAFQWYHDSTPLTDGGDISGAYTEVLTITNVEPQDAGNYYCTATLGCIVAPSDTVQLSLVTQLKILTQPDPTVSICEGNTASFTISAQGEGISYLWYKDGFPLEDGGRITGTHATTMIITETCEADAGDYTCQLVDTCGIVVETDPSVLTLALAFTETPQDICREVDDTAVFTSAAVASPPETISYYWKKGEVWLSDGGNISGAWSPTLTITNLTAGDAGEYSVFAMSSICNILSQPATLQVGNCPTECPNPGDMDGDTDYDLADLQLFTVCFNANVNEQPDCVCANIVESNEYVDLEDWTALEAILTGPQ